MVVVTAPSCVRTPSYLCPVLLFSPLLSLIYSETLRGVFDAHGLFQQLSRASLLRGAWTRWCGERWLQDHLKTLAAQFSLSIWRGTWAFQGLEQVLSARGHQVRGCRQATSHTALEVVTTPSAKSGTSLLGIRALVGKRVSHVTFAPVPSSLKDLVVFYVLLFFFCGTPENQEPKAPRDPKSL